MDKRSVAMNRPATFGFLALGDTCLTGLLRPSKRHLKCALITSFAVASADFIFELLMRRFKVWEYDLSCSVLGMPVDLFTDFFLWVFAYCTGHAAFDRTHKPRAYRRLYMVIVSLLLGSWAFHKNSRASQEGMISFAGSVDVGTPWFAVGNYVLIFLLVLLISRVYSFTFKRLQPAGE